MKTTDKSQSLRILIAGAIVLATAGFAAATPALAAPTPPKHRYVVVAKSDADYDALRAEAQKTGATILQDEPEIHQLVILGSDSQSGQLAASTHAQGVAADEMMSADPIASLLSPARGGASPATIDLGASSQPAVTPDPAFNVPGLLWNVARIGGPQAWKVTTGDPSILVGVADTGLDYTHAELASQVAQVVDFSDPTLCPTYFGRPSDQQMAAQFGGPANGDWAGHGSWIGGNIAAALDGQGINGIAPHVKLVSLKIAQNCNSAFDSTMIQAIVYAATHGIDVVSISFVGYLNMANPNNVLLYQQFVAAVAFARANGTVVVAAAGNDHVRVGAGGQVLSHVFLQPPGSAPFDPYGLYQAPGGIPGVVDVSATGNEVAGPSASCAVGTADLLGLDTCKPGSDAHQPFGVGQRNQLAFYSNYGPRIDVAAPGGTEKFNLPPWDRGGTMGFPYTGVDGTRVWGAFSITSNWAPYTPFIPCFYFNGGGFPAHQCYTTILGTSMATPHVSAVLALIASAHPELRHKPGALVDMLKATARHLEGNATPPLNAGDTSGGDVTGGSCASGGCHLGGEPISDREAYGAGLVDAARAVGDD
jgi:subtilisin family serine protease